MRRLAIFAAAFAAATACFVYILGDARALLAAGACLVLSVVCRSLGARRTAIALLGASVAFVWCAGYTLISPDRAQLGEDQTVCVRVTDLPRKTLHGYSVDAELDGFEVRMHGGSEAETLMPGDVVTCRARVEKTDLTRNGEESLYLRSKGFRYCVYADEFYTVEQGHLRWTEKIRMDLRQRIESLYQGEISGFLQALLIGDRSDLSQRVQNDFSVAGISHTIAVSGMHVSMLLTILALLCGGNARMTALIGIPLVICFALMTGASASVCRAAAMQILLLCAPLVHREHDTPTSLGVAAILLLMINPWSIADVSFQLSFAAVLGLALFASPIQNAILSRKKYPGRFLKFLASSVAATLAATVTTLPLTAAYFGMISLAALPVNLLTLWAVTAVFALGLFSCIPGSVGVVLSFPVRLLVRYILWISRHVATIPFAAAYPENLPMMLWAGVAYILTVVLLLVRKKKFVQWSLSVLTAAFVACLLVGNGSMSRGGMTFTAADVGQGQCLVLNSRDFSAVIDCGGSNDREAGNAAVRLLHSAGVTRLDALVITHYDNDHMGGVPYLLDRVTVDRIFVPDYPSEKRQELETLAAVSGTEIVPVEFGADVTFRNGYLRIMSAENGLEGNDASLCVLAKAADCGILITGDRTEKGEFALLKRWSIPQVDLLVAGHHGSKSSTSAFLLKTVSPETVLISAEEGNAYEHPSPVVLKRIDAAGAKILRTDLQGRITVAGKQ